MARRLIAFVVMSLWLVAAVSVAQADTGDIVEPQNEPPTAANGWQAGVCETDEPCTPATPEDFFLTAGGHPPIGFTQYIIRHTTTMPGVIEPLVEPLEGRAIKTLRVDLPPGLAVNPEATPERCTLADFLFSPEPGLFVPQCEAATVTGEEQVNVVTNKDNVEFPPGSGEIIANKGTRLPLIPGVFQVPVYNLVPKPGEPALFGFVIAGRAPIFLETEVAWESDFHQSFKIKLNPASASDLQTIISRLVSFGDTTGNGTFITNPTTCFDPAEWDTLYSTWYRAESFEEPDPSFPNGTTPFEARVEDDEGNLYQQEDCDTIPFEPDVGVNPGTGAIDSPSPATVTTEVPFEVPDEGGDEQAQSQVRRVELTLPNGMGLNPSGSKGLVACSDADFKKGQRVVDNTCPVDSKIGSIEVETPPLPDGSLKGDVYIGEQKSNDPASGEQFRILAEAKSEQLGVVARLVGHTAADPVSGQLTTVFDEQEVGPLAGPLPRGLPQIPFESVTLRFDGSKSVLTSPPTCSTAQSTGQLEPWARPGEQAPVTSAFTLSSDPGGGTCPTTLGARRFTPGYDATTENSIAGADTKLRVQIGRGDGEQEVKGVDVTLPEGLIGSLAGLLYCPDVNLEVAAQKSGHQELVNPSCPEVSQIGETTTAAGSGPDPVSLGGDAYLAGPYKGAALSMAVITPARSGPFDLGNVIVRVALFVDPETTEITAVSDPIPHVFGGVKLDLRAIDVHVDRPRFMRNGTDCSEPLATRGTIEGGGANPNDQAAFSSYPVSSYYRPAECRRLEFEPKLFTRLFGGRNVTQRAKHPSLRAVLEAREGDANIGRAALVMPRALFLDQSNIRTVCTRVQLAAGECPKAAIYGHARATSPLLDGNLKGPVYLVSSNNELPDLLADLRGQVNVRLRGVISSVRGGLKTVFRSTPDVPVSKFILRMQGGRKKGLLQNSRNLCKGRLFAFLNLTAQNSRRVRTNQQPIRVGAC